MGLLSRISAGIDIPAEANSINESLLESSLKKETGKLSFFDFLKKNSISHCAVFSKAESFYSFCFSWGFDSATVLQSISTSDFWEGSTKLNQWTLFSSETNNLNTILQFFPDSQKKSFSASYVYNAGNYLLLIANEKNIYSDSELKKLSEDFNIINFSNTEFISESSKKNNNIQLTVNFTAAISEYSGKLNPVLKSQIQQALYSECICLLSTLSDKNISIKTSEGSDFRLFVSIHSDANISQNSIRSFLTESLKKVFGNRANLISYEC